MIRTLAAFTAALGILVMSMPGGLCFVLMGAGLDHHHHAQTPVAGEICLHHHDHGEGEHTHGEGEGDLPEEPCIPTGNSTDTLAMNTVFKVDPAVLPLVADFKPEWATAPEQAFEAESFSFDPVDAIDPSPPPVVVRFCCFLI